MKKRKKNKAAEELTPEETIEHFKESVQMVIEMHLADPALEGQPHEAARRAERDANWALRETYRQIYPGEPIPEITIRYVGNDVIEVRLKNA